MLEWFSIPTSKFMNPSGVMTDVKLRHEFPVVTDSYLVDCKGKDLDLVAFEERGSSMDALLLLEANAQVISEYDFDMEKVEQLRIPIG